MSHEKIVNAADNTFSFTAQGDEHPVLLKKIGKTTYRITIHFSAASRETMSDKIKRMLRNEIAQM